MALSPTEARVVGCLVEKQLSTPQQYPLTLNALVLGCNQSSNRDPVLSLSESECEAALSQLKQERLVRFVLPSHGRSVVRYRHVLDEQWSLDPPQLAVLACLLLRGAQTVGELRARTERMVSFEDVGETEHTLELLADREVPLTAPVPRRPGQKEARWTQLLAPGAESEGPGPTILSDRPPPEGDHDTLRAEVDELRRQLDDLRSLVENLRTSLGG